MPVLLFRLNGVPSDEADEIRELLEGREIEFYETDAGRWGISIAAIWLRGEEQLEDARRLIADYQRARELKMRKEFDAKRAAGMEETLFTRFRSSPVRFTLYLLAIIAVIYLTVLPFTRTW